MRRRHRTTLVLAALICAGLLGAACGSDDDGASPTTAATAEGATTTAAGSAATAAENQERLNLVMGGSQSGSSVFAFLTAHARLAAEADGNMLIQVRETNATAENMQGVSDGAMDFGLSSWETTYLAHNGLNQYEGKAQPHLLNLLNYLRNAEFLVVREDAGIDSIYDLDGKPFAPGFQGSGVAVKVETMLKELGIEPEIFVGSLEDITNAMKDGRIVGFGKAANGLKADASFLDVHSATPIKPLGFSAEDVATLTAKYPYYQFVEVPAGAIGDSPAFTTSMIYANYFAHADMPEDEAYRLTKALWASLEEAATQTNYDGAKGREYSETVETRELLPLHPGAERFYREVGALPS